MTDHELFKKILFALEWNLPIIENHGEKEQFSLQHRSINALRERLKQPDQEPVAWMYRDAWGVMKLSQTTPPPVGAFPVYSTPPQRKPLTYKQILNISKECRAVERPSILWVTFARAIEAVHGIKENNT
jgi:hypothetical protein